MAAKGEEVVVQADFWQAEDFAPDRGDVLLQRRFGFDVLTGFHTGSGNARRSSLPLGLRGIASKRVNSAGTIYSGNSAARAVFMSCSSSALLAV